ncbi:uncharacterized protein LOC143073410 isoform X1 [Mytilus galloprovincialis]|uniref:uncharacterized protein LOC143073410 isoform X1 n=1 Tax=Mytilus galloprovincialis TaxID=29158 RepID=UPI003F7BBB58
MTTIVNPGFEDFRPEKVQSAGNHQCVMAEIDKINKDLQELKDGLVDTSDTISKRTTIFGVWNDCRNKSSSWQVRCHMLEVELATQFSPYMVSTVRNTKQDCAKCTETIRNYVGAVSE